MSKTQPTSRPIAFATLAVIALLLAGAGYWLLRTAGVFGGGEDIIVLRPATPRPGPAGPGGAPGAAASEGGGVVVPTSRPPHRPPVSIALAEVPASFRDRTATRPRVTKGGSPAGRTESRRAPVPIPLAQLPDSFVTRAAAATRRSSLSPAAQVESPPDPLTGVRPALKKDPALFAWFARWQADVSAERPTGEARLRDLERVMQRASGRLSSAEAAAVARAIATVEGHDSRVLATWQRMTAPAAGHPAAPKTVQPNAKTDPRPARTPTRSVGR